MYLHINLSINSFIFGLSFPPYCSQNQTFFEGPESAHDIFSSENPVDSAFTQQNFAFSSHDLDLRAQNGNRLQNLSFENEHAILDSIDYQRLASLLEEKQVSPYPTLFYIYLYVYVFLQF